MRLFRVFPQNVRAALHERGGALFLPPGSSGRIDNPDMYRVLYCSDSAEGAVAEIFGRLPVWSDEMFVHPNGIRYALAELELPDSSKICDLDNAQVLLRLNLTPSDVVSRDRNKTQTWGRTIYNEGQWIGTRWWSYYEPAWHNYGVWNYASLGLVSDPIVLRPTVAAVQDAATVIVRLVQA